MCDLVVSALEDEFPRAVLRDSLREFVEELCGLDDDALPLMARELLGTALCSVDWYAMAVDYIAEHGGER